jgi:hypothetical protein
MEKLKKLFLVIVRVSTHKGTVPAEPAVVINAGSFLCCRNSSDYRIAKNAMNRRDRKEYKNLCVPCAALANLAILVLRQTGAHLQFSPAFAKTGTKQDNESGRSTFNKKILCRRSMK